LEGEVAFAALKRLGGEVLDVRDKDLLGESQRPVELRARRRMDRSEALI